MKLGVVGAGTMGGGIAQVGAQQGMDVVLLDVRAELVEGGIGRIRTFLQRNVERGRMSQGDADATIGRITPSTDFSAFADVDCVIEAALEEISVKADIFRRLDGVCRPDAILASNTSSLSVTEIGASTTRPDRVVGMHFFNPVPLMALVEVIRGSDTSPEAMDRAVEVAHALGKTPVRGDDTPGFIVNRIVRPFYNEALRIYGDGVASTADIDRVMKGNGFRMGPFELMDLIGNDVNYAVTTSIFNQLYGEPKFRPSFRQLRIVQSGNLGQKTKRGFYSYDAGGVGPPASVEATPVVPMEGPVAVFADSALGVAIAEALAEGGSSVRLAVVRAGVATSLPISGLDHALGGAAGVVDATIDPARKREVIARVGAEDLPAATLALTVPAAEIVSWSERPENLCGFGLLPPLKDARVLEVAVAMQSSDAAAAFADRLAGALGRTPVRIGDGTGQVAARIVSLIVNEASTALMEGIATVADIDAAVRLGANYPRGPLEWADEIGVDLVYAIISGMYAEYGEDRYRPTPLLRRMALAGRTGRATGRGFYDYAKGG